MTTWAAAVGLACTNTRPRYIPAPTGVREPDAAAQIKQPNLQRTHRRPDRPGHLLSQDGQCFFVKTAGQSADKMFKGEALGLQSMYHAGAVRIPKVYACEDDGSGSYIIMEYLSLGGKQSRPLIGVRCGR
jgi:hypothetical protein